MTATPRRRWWIYLLAGTVLAGFGIWFGIRLMNRWRIEGEGFRVNVSRRLSELADRSVSTARFRQTGSQQLSTATLTFSPVRQDLLSSAVLSNVTADLTPGSWLADDWTIESLRFRQADFAFQPNKPPLDEMLWKSTPAPVNRGVAPKSEFRISMTSDPATVIVEQGLFDKVNLTWPGPGGQPESLSQLSGNFRLIDGIIQMEVGAGVLDTAAWPPFLVRQLNVRLKGTDLEIVSARLGLTAEHEVRLTGRARLTPDGQVDLKADIAPLLLRNLLPEAWKGTVLGTFEAGEAVWTSHFGGGPETSFSGPFRVRGFVLRSLPFVDKIAALLRKPELALMEFPLLTGQFQWTPAGTRLTDLSATTADGLLRVKGTATAQPGDAVSASFVLEASEAYFAGAGAGISAEHFVPGPEGWRSLAFSIDSGNGAVTDTIAIANPVILQQRPVPAAVEMPRLTLPPGVTVPPAAPRAAVVPTRPPVAMPPPAPPRVPVPAAPPSEAELERQFNDLLGR